MRIKYTIKKGEQVEASIILSKKDISTIRQLGNFNKLVADSLDDTEFYKYKSPDGKFNTPNKTDVQHVLLELGKITGL